MTGLNTMKKLRKPWRSRHRRLVVDYLILVLCLGASLMLAKPAYRVFRDWRTGKIAENAAEALAAGDFAEARRLARTVLVTQSERHDMLVILQRSMEALNDPDAAHVSRMLMVHPEATEEDRIRGFRDTCSSMPIAMVTATWMALGEEKAYSPAYLLPFATRWIDQGLNDVDGPMLIERADLALEPELRLQAVRGLMKSNKDPSLRLAQSHIAELMADGGGTALPAFRLLAGVPLEKFRADGFPDLEGWILTQPEATVDDQLLALIQKRHRFPGQLSELVKHAITRFAGKNPAAVGRWLNQIGLAGETLKLLSEEQAAADVEPFLARADALIALERWPEAIQWLAAPPDKVSMIELHSRRMICDGKPGKAARQGKAWTEALLEVGAGPDPDVLLEFSRRMHEAGLEELAGEAMVAAVRTKRGRLPFWHQIRHLLPWLRARQQGQAMSEVCSLMASLQPSNPEVAIEALDLDCILGKSQSAALLEQLEQLEKQHPGISEEQRFRELKATVLLQAEQPEAALAACGPYATESGNTSDRLIAVAAVAKAILGENETSAQLFERVVWKRMLREEKEFFTNLLAKLSAPGTTEPIGNRFDPKILPPTDERFETPEIPELLPPLEGEFGSDPDPASLQPIPDSIRLQFEPKKTPPVESQ